MDTWLSDVLSQIGVPSGAVLIAVGLVRGAKSLEKDANKEALSYISDLLKGGMLSNLGKVTAATIPVIFQRVFGGNPISFKFVSRSMVATTLLWITLILLKPPTLVDFRNDIQNNLSAYIWGIPLFYIVDWISLSKSRFIINAVYQKTTLNTTFLFLALDIFLSFLMPVFIANILLFIFLITWDIFHFNFPIIIQLKVLYAESKLYFYTPMATEYFTHKNILVFASVFVPSTLLTSFWTSLLFLSNFVALLFYPVERLRILTLWWFRDVEKHPLTVIAKVTGTLIIATSLAISAIRHLSI
jgi:hypothetical protein